MRYGGDGRHELDRQRKRRRARAIGAVRQIEQGNGNNTKKNNNPKVINDRKYLCSCRYRPGTIRERNIARARSNLWQNTQSHQNDGENVGYANKHLTSHR